MIGTEMSKELDELYLKLRKKQADLIHCRFKYIAERLEHQIKTIEYEIERQKKKEGLDYKIDDNNTPF